MGEKIREYETIEGMGSNNMSLSTFICDKLEYGTPIQFTINGQAVCLSEKQLLDIVEVIQIVLRVPRYKIVSPDGEKRDSSL